MFGIGIGEIILILVIGTLVVGPERMVSFARDAGRILAKFRRETDSVSQEFREALELDELRGVLNEAQSELQGVAKDLQSTQQEVQAIVADTQATVVGAAAEASSALSAPASARVTAAATNRPPQVTPAVLAPTLLRDGEMHPTDARQAAADGNQPESEDAAMEVGVPEIVLEDHEVEPVVLDEPILVMDKEEAEQAEAALREIAVAGAAEALEEGPEQVEEMLPPEAEVAQALEGGASMVIAEPSVVEDEEDENVIQEDVVVAWETDVQLVVEDEEPQDSQAAEAIAGGMLSEDEVAAVHSQDNTEAEGAKAEEVSTPDTVDDDEAGISDGATVSATEEDAVEDGDSKG